MTTRLKPLDPQRAPLLTRLMYRYAKRRFGQVPEPFAVYAHHPRLLRANAVHEGLLQRASTTLPAGVRELAVYWTARTVGCSWCVDFGAVGMVELNYQIGVENMRARMNSAQGITEQGFGSGESCRVPWAQA